MKTNDELKRMFFENENSLYWERYDFVDPPYCWSVMAEIELEGYKFYVDGIETVNLGYETTSVEVETPDGERFMLIG